MSKEIEEIKSELEALALKIERFEASKVEFCGDGYTVYCDGGIGRQTDQKLKTSQQSTKQKNKQSNAEECCTCRMLSFS